MSRRIRCRSCRTAFVTTTTSSAARSSAPSAGPSRSPPTGLTPAAGIARRARPGRSSSRPTPPASPPPRPWRVAVVVLALLAVAAVAVVVAWPAIRRWWHPVPPDPVETVATAYLQALVDGDTEAAGRLGTVDLPPAIRTFRASSHDKDRDTRAQGLVRPDHRVPRQGRRDVHLRPLVRPVHPAERPRPRRRDARRPPRGQGQGRGRRPLQEDAERRPRTTSSTPPRAWRKPIAALAKGVARAAQADPLVQAARRGREAPAAPAERALALDFAANRETWDLLLKRPFTYPEGRRPVRARTRRGHRDRSIDALGSSGDPPTPLRLTLTRFRLEGIDTGWHVTSARREGVDPPPAVETEPPPAVAPASSRRRPARLTPAWRRRVHNRRGRDRRPQCPGRRLASGDVERVDKVLINDLVARGIIGVNDWEREHAQEIVINLVLFTDLAAAGASDDLADCVNYQTVADKVLAHAADRAAVHRRGAGGRHRRGSRSRSRASARSASGSRSPAPSGSAGRSASRSSATRRPRRQRPTAPRSDLRPAPMIDDPREHSACLGLGSNSAPEVHLPLALAALGRAPGVEVVAVSSAWESPAVGTARPRLPQRRPARDDPPLPRRLKARAPAGRGRPRPRPDGVVPSALGDDRHRPARPSTARCSSPTSGAWPTGPCRSAELLPDLTSPSTGESLADAAHRLEPFDSDRGTSGNPTGDGPRGRTLIGPEESMADRTAMRAEPLVQSVRGGIDGQERGCGRDRGGPDLPVLRMTHRENR